MSKTLRCTVSFDLKMVFTGESLKELSETREQAREIIQTGLCQGRKVHGSQKAMVEMFASPISDEELLERIVRAGLRQFIREDLTKELSGASDGSSTVGNVKVAFKEPMKPRQVCDLHDDSKACTSLCKRFTESN